MDLKINKNTKRKAVEYNLKTFVNLWYCCRFNISHPPTKKKNKKNVIDSHAWCWVPLQNTFYLVCRQDMDTNALTLINS